MAASAYWLKPLASLRGLLVQPTSLTLFACVLVFCCISSTSRLMINLHKTNDNHPAAAINNAGMIQISLPKPTTSSVLELHVLNVSDRDDHHDVMEDDDVDKTEDTQSQLLEEASTTPIVLKDDDDEAPDTSVNNEETESQLPEDQNLAAPIVEAADDEATDTSEHRREDPQNQWPQETPVDIPAEVDDEAHDHALDSRREGTDSNTMAENNDEAHETSEPRREGTENQLPEENPPAHIGNFANDDNDVYHDNNLFFENYKAMNRSLKIYVYPHSANDKFANVLLPERSEPGGNYASESYFKKSLMKSHFITKDPAEADFFFLPFSITGMRNDKRIGVGGMQDYVQKYVSNVKRKYPYWNRTGGADHFYVACHSIGKIAMEKAPEVKDKAIQVVCSSNYFVSGYVAHKDVSMPQIWPRQGHPPRVEPSKRKRLAFFAGASNAPTRQALVKAWRNDAEIFAHEGRLKTPYEIEFQRSKFCFHVKGYEVNTARIGDAMFYGCVPVVLANHYDLPFGDILNWKSFSVVVETSDIPLMKSILKGIGAEEYLRLHKNVEKARKHFQWHSEPIDYDCFHMVMYELWLRRNYVRVPLS